MSPNVLYKNLMKKVRASFFFKIEHITFHKCTKKFKNVYYLQIISLVAYSKLLGVIGHLIIVLKLKNR